MKLEFLKSLNNRLVVEVYKKGELRHKESNGFAFVDQKVKVHGLKTLMDAKLNDGDNIPSGSIVFIKEESLHTAAWAQKAYECDGIEGKFMIIDISVVEFVNAYFLRIGGVST